MSAKKMFIDPARPGVIRWDDDPLSGILAGIRAPEIVKAVNERDELIAALKAIVEKGECVFLLMGDESEAARSFDRGVIAAFNEAAKIARAALAKAETP